MIDAMAHLNNGLSPLPSAQNSAADDAAVLSCPNRLSKLGVKGPKLVDWARTHGIELPLKLYDVQHVDSSGVLARVGKDEIILECPPDDALMVKLQRILDQPTAGVYRIEQQSVTIELAGKFAHSILTQTCGVNFSREPADRIVFTRIAGASCGVIVRQILEQRIYRVWVDHSLAIYLRDRFDEIVRSVKTQEYS